LSVFTDWLSREEKILPGGGKWGTEGAEELKIRKSSRCDPQKQNVGGRKQNTRSQEVLRRGQYLGKKRSGKEEI